MDFNMLPDGSVRITCGDGAWLVPCDLWRAAINLLGRS